MRDGDSDIYPCKGSLRDFEVLKEVVLDSFPYLEHASYDGSKFNPDQNSYAGDHVHTIRHLEDVLPHSIETIQFVGSKVLNDASSLLVDLFEQKELRLPKLSNLIIESRDHRPKHGWGRVLGERSEKVGVTLYTTWERS